MNQHLFRHIDIDPARTHVPNGLADDLQKECKRYDALIGGLGGVDLQVLGIGRNGHIGFNEPATSFSSKTHVVKLTPSTRQANARYFRDFDEVPTSAITMGIATILSSREILLLASGEDKDWAIERLLYGEIDESFPASALKNHPHVTFVADKKALSRVLVPS
ncbi:hypothetical protein GCM10011571_16820 [Marinithermofilum abyssi]|uniref:Glucosamine/galactosamine-6-phosphate isomerase domain-containing protein n=1 Tax=Marinithermofilum abyssi TaxID=1571185 RepID=A0A8J2YE01_9BACL|nr:hypothetical protein GCM10011571_16820 [Marinithermofilum abyssi]